MNRIEGESAGIPFIEFSVLQEKPVVIFLHANAFPPDCYIPLFEKLSENYKIICPLFRPQWNIPGDRNQIRTWSPLLHDMVQFLKSFNPDQPKILLGHSLGGNIGFRLCLEYPDIVDSAALMDPIIFSRQTIFFWQFIQWTKIGWKIHPMIKASKNQRLAYPSKKAMIDRFRSKRIFSKISDTNLNYLIKGLTQDKDGGGVELSFPKDWELQIYQAGMVADKEIWKRIQYLAKKILILKAEHTHSPTENVVRKLSDKSSFIQSEKLKGYSHFFPFEVPDVVGEKVIKFLN